MKHSIWSAYAIAPPAGPLLYNIIALFIPEVTNRKEFSVITWIASLAFFSISSYIACIIFGGPLIALLKRLNKFTFWWVVVPASILYAVALCLLLFVILQGKITGNKISVISGTLLVGFGLGVIVTALFCFVAGIASRRTP